MKKQELYTKMGMDKYYSGDSFIVDRDKSFSNLLSEIDNISIFENKNTLGENWNELNFSDCSDLLLHDFNFDLAFQDVAIMPTEKAEYYRTFIISKFKESETKCFTNWLQNPWKSKNMRSWNPITANTFDMAIVLADSSKIAYTYFITED